MRHQTIWLIASSLLGVLWAPAASLGEQLQAAETQFTEANYPAAVQLFEQIVSADPDSEAAATAAYRLGYCHLRLDQSAKAIASFEQALERYPDHPQAREAAYELGRSYLDQRQPEAALAAFRQAAVPGAPADLADLAALGIGASLLQLERFAEAADHYQLLLADLPENRQGEVRLLLSDAYLALQQNEEVVAVLQPLIDRGQAPPAARYRLAIAQAQLGRADAARANLEALLAEASSPDLEVQARISLADLLADDDQHEAAIEQFRQVTGQGASPALQARAQLGLGWSYLQTGNAAAALQAFAAASQPSAPPEIAREATLQQAAIHFSRGRYSQARPLAAKLADEPGPRGARAAYILGWCLKQADEPDAAIERFSQAIRQDSNANFVVDASLNLAKLLRQRADLAASRQVLDRIAGRVEGEARRLWVDAYGDLLVSLKAWPDLIAFYDQLPTPADDEQPLATALTYPVGLAHQEIGQYDQARHFFTRVIERGEPEAAKAEYQLGVIAYLQDEFMTAGHHFQRVESEYEAPQLTPTALYHAIDAYRQAKDPEKPSGEAIYAHLKRTYPDSPWTAKAAQLLGKTEPPPLFP